MAGWKKWFIYTLMIVLALVVCGIGYYNYKTNEQFLSVNASNIFTMAWAILFSFIITQMFTAHKRRADVMVQLIRELKSDVENPAMYKIPFDADKSQILLRKKSLSNKIDILKKHAGKYGIKNDVAFVEEKYKEYDAIIGEHIQDIPYLSKSESSLERPLACAATKLFEIMLKI